MILTEPTELASLQSGKNFGGRGAAEKNAALEEGRKEVVDFTGKIRADLHLSWKQTKTWRMAAEESYSFVENDQWNEKDRKTLTGEGRPVLTFNDVLPIVRILSGIERQNREEMRVFPREGGDADSSEIMTQLIRYVDDENLGTFQKIRKSNDVYVTGRGYIKTDISYDENVLGDIVYKRRNPLSIFIDVLSEEWTGGDWGWVADSLWMTENQAKELWPEFEDQIKVGDWLSGRMEPMAAELVGDPLENKKLFLDEETRRVRIFEYWYKKREVIILAVNLETGDVRPATDQFQALYKDLDQAEREKIKLIRRKATVIKVATLLHWLLLQDKFSPFDHKMFPIVPYIGIQYFREPWGIVEYLKDPQRVRNKTHSQALNHLNRSAHSGWLNQESRGADPNQLEKFGSVPGVVVDYRETKPDQITPAPLSSGHLSLSKESQDSIKGISLINAEIQGLSTQRTVSGKAIEARQRGGFLGNEDFFDNQLLGDKILGQQLISLIQQVFTSERIMRIVSNLSLRDVNSQMTAIMKQKEVILPQIIDKVLKSEYDYVVDRAPSSATIRQEQFRDLKETAKDFPGSIPPDVLVDASDYPEDIKQRIKLHIEKQMETASAAPTNGGSLQ